jgi:hypothetical protein
MHKIFFGTIVFFSLAFLAACGGGGSGSAGSAGATGAAGAAGADGAAGATGATGATGAVAAFTDADLNISYNGASGAVAGSTPTAVPLDNGTTIGAISGELIVSGVDNISSLGSSSKYYLYEVGDNGLSSTMKLATAGATYTEAAGVMNPLYDTNMDDAVLDTRHVLTTGNIKVGLAEWVPVTNFTAGTDFNTASFTACPGNVAGDGSCAKVLAPVYDRGLGTLSPLTVNDGTLAAMPVRSVETALKASIVYTGTDFNVFADNGTGGTTSATTGFAGMGFRVATYPKTGFGSAVTSDNASPWTNSPGALTGTVDVTKSFHRVDNGTHLNARVYDNNTKFSDIISRNYDNGSRTTWVVNTSYNHRADQTSDNLTIFRRADGAGFFTDNGSRNDLKSLTTAPQIGADADSVYILAGASTVIQTVIAYDNGTMYDADNSTILTADTWCSAVPSAGGYAAIVSDNGTASGTAGIAVTKVFDNGTSAAVTVDNVSATVGILNNFVNLESGCALTMLGSRAYLAVVDSATVDNMSVWYSDDWATWNQIGGYWSTSHATTSAVAIGTIGNTSSGASSTGDVWVAVNENGTVNLYHYEDIAGGSSPAWRLVAPILTSAGTAGVSLATDNSSIIAVTGIVSNRASIGWWYNQ